MNRDLENQLDEMGPEYRAVALRLKAGGDAQDFRRETSDACRRGFMSKVSCLKSYLTAASLFAVVGLGVLFMRTSDERRGTPSREVSASAGREYLLALAGSEAAMREMIATQNPDGSWQNDFLTRRNAAALKLWGERSVAAQVAYKRAMRNLRMRGVL